jgi:hypothetical protein
MNKNKPNNDNLVKYHIRLNAEECERLKERLKEHLHHNKLHSYHHPSETLKSQWEQVIKSQLSPSAIQEIKDRIAKRILTNEDQKKRVYTYYLSSHNNLDILRSAVLNFTITPQNSLKHYYKKINYAQSINESLEKDWNNVYEDLNTGFLSALKEQLANKPNNKESDEREFGQ